MNKIYHDEDFLEISRSYLKVNNLIAESNISCKNDIFGDDIFELKVSHNELIPFNKQNSSNFFIDKRLFLTAPVIEANDCNYIYYVKCIFLCHTFSNNKIQENTFVTFIDCISYGDFILGRFHENLYIDFYNSKIENFELYTIHSKILDFAESSFKSIKIQYSNILSITIRNSKCNNLKIEFSEINYATFDSLSIDDLYFDDLKTGSLLFDFLNSNINTYINNLIVKDNFIIEYYNIWKQVGFTIFENSELEKKLVTYGNLVKVFRYLNESDKELDMLFYYKKYENKIYNKKLKWLIYFFLEKSTKYFTSWTRTLLSTIFGFVFFTLFYLLFPSYLKINNVGVSNWNITSGFFNGKIDLNVFYNCIYFSLVSITTTGYGDIQPIGFIRFIAGLEGIFGVIFFSFFSVSLTKKILG